MYKRGKIYYERFKYPDGSAKRICLGTDDEELAEKVKAKNSHRHHYGQAFRHKTLG